MYQKKFIQGISIVALVLAIAACEQAQEPTKGATVKEPTKGATVKEPTKSATVKLEATKIGEVADLVGPSSQCGAPDGQKDQGIRLQIPSELGAKVSYLELLASGKVPGQWDSCSSPVKGWSLAVTGEGSDKPMDEKLDLSKGGAFVIHAADNGAFANKSSLELRGMDKDGQEVFHVAVSG